MIFSSKFCKFYKSTFILIVTINLTLFFLLGSYFEEYESILSTMVHGTYTNHAVKEWNLDTHFLLFSVYSYINSMLPDVLFYGVVLFLMNWTALLLFGCVLYRILKVNLNFSDIKVFLLLYSVVAIDYIVNLGSTRIAFLIVVSIIGFIESNKLEKRTIHSWLWVILGFLIFICSLIRTEIVLLIVGLYSFILFLNSEFNKHTLYIISIPVAVLITYNLIALYYLPESRQIYYFKEFDFIDRDNVDYKNLSSIQLLDVSAFKKYLISDEVHFTNAFYDTVSSNLNRFNIKSIINTFTNSVYAFKVSWYYLFFSFVTGLYLILSVDTFTRRNVLQIIFCIFFPFLLCFYLTVPLRFLIFYYSVISVLNLLIIIKNGLFNRLFLLCTLLFTVAIVYKEVGVIQKYKMVNNKFESANVNLKLISEKYSHEKPVVVNTLEYMGRYFPVKPLQLLRRQHVMFLNFWYYGAYDCYRDKWEEVCDCNSLSLIGKLDYIVQNNVLFITGERDFIFLQQYVQKKYSKKIEKEDISGFDSDLILCRLTYIN